MQTEKQTIGEYEILSSVHVGEKEVVLCCNEKATDGNRFMCGYLEINEIFKQCTECVASDDYVEIAGVFGSRIAEEAKLFQEERSAMKIPITVLTEKDCIPDQYSNDINKKVIAIRPTILKPEFQQADHQIYLVTGGFGANGNSRGRAVFCKNVYTGKETRYERGDVMGEVKPECLPEWAREKLKNMGKFHEKTNKDRER